MGIRVPVRRSCAGVLMVMTLASGSVGGVGGISHAAEPPRQVAAVATDTAAWFEVVAAIPGDHLAIVAPAANDVWVAVRTEDGLAMAHYDRYDWTTTPVLPGRTVPAEPQRTGDRRAVLATNGPDDIWLTAGGGLAHYDGTGWTQVDAPIDAAGRPLEVLTVATAPGRVVVGTRDSRGHGNVWRREGGTWRALGEPYDMPRVSAFVPREVKLLGRETVMVLFSQSSNVYRQTYPVVWWHDSRRWSPLYQFEPPGFHTWGQQTAWIVRDDWRHLFFGYGDGKGMPLHGTCRYAHTPGMTRGCSTELPISSAVQRKDRSVVLATGGYPDIRHWDRPTPGQLRLRALDGTERVVGQATLWNDFETLPASVVAVEPDGMTVWAATGLGLQRLGRPSL